MATTRVDELESAHDICFRLWDRTATLLPGSVVRIVVGKVYPPVFLADVRADLAYAIDTWDGLIADAWLEALSRTGAEAVLV